MSKVGAVYIYRRHGKFGAPVDMARCRAAVHDSFGVRFHQCSRKVGGTVKIERMQFCKQHAMLALPSDKPVAVVSPAPSGKPNVWIKAAGLGALIDYGAGKERRRELPYDEGPMRGNGGYGLVGIEFADGTAIAIQAETDETDDENHFSYYTFWIR
jgi:hypothetical protein